VREQVQGFVDDAVEDAEAKLQGHAIPRLSDHAVAALAAIMGRHLRGMFEE
jgi:hypothetical protein